MSSRENDNIQLVRWALNALNAGDTTNVSELSALHTLILSHRRIPLDRNERAPRVYRYRNEYSKCLFRSTL